MSILFFLFFLFLMKSNAYDSAYNYSSTSFPSFVCLLLVHVHVYNLAPLSLSFVLVHVRSLFLSVPVHSLPLFLLLLPTPLDTTRTRFLSCPFRSFFKFSLSSLFVNLRRGLTIL